MHDPIVTDRETARAKLSEKLAWEREFLARKQAEAHLPAALRQNFSTMPSEWIIEDAEWRLRWIDCAPDGANHQCAPLQDKQGVPMGTARNENVGPGLALREARAARGLNPFSGIAYHDGREF